MIYFTVVYCWKWECYFITTCPDIILCYLSNYMHEIFSPYNQRTAVMSSMFQWLKIHKNEFLIFAFWHNFVKWGDNRCNSVIMVINDKNQYVNAFVCLHPDCDQMFEVSISMILSYKLIPLLNLSSLHLFSLPLSKFSLCSDQHYIHWSIHSFIQDCLTLH